MAKDPPLFSSEADLVARFCEAIKPSRSEPEWTAYHETAGWDLLLVHNVYGYQIGIEAKMTLNAKVLEQALPNISWHRNGPDYRAVLVPRSGLQNHLELIAHHLGIVVITVSGYRGWHIDGRPGGWSVNPSLPNVDSEYHSERWPSWYPAQREALPDYVPDVVGGKAAPLTLSLWKIKAIKLLILLEKRGWVTRADLDTLDISASRWTALYDGYLDRGAGRVFIRGRRTPDFKSLHPTNWAQIEADFETWGAKFTMGGRLPL